MMLISLNAQVRQTGASDIASISFQVAYTLYVYEEKKGKKTEQIRAEE